MRVVSMSRENLVTVEVNLGSRIWSGTKPIQSIHKHLGYVMYENTEKIIIAPELTFSFEGSRLRVGHEVTVNKTGTPRPLIRRLSASSEETITIETKYADPSHKEGILSEQEAKDFKPSTLQILGYLVQQNEHYFWVAIGKFEYIDGTIDYETVHVIPKESIRHIVHLK